MSKPLNGRIHPPADITQIALAACLCLASTGALAQDATLNTVTVTDTASAPLKTDVAPSAKFTAPLIDTPKTVQVVNEELIRQTGATSLQEALRSAPGITFGNGEGGSPNGDQPFIRGMDSQSSTFVDGMRDIAAGTREVFNLESVEIIKGADSAFAGRGGAGGSINLVTKRAKSENFISGDVGLGTDSYKRGTLDINRKINDTTGFRLNAMAHDADVPGRNGPSNQRWGIAPTVTFGMGTPTEVTLSWQHLQTDNVPDGGVPYLYTNSAMAKLPGGSTVRPTFGNSRDNWYGLYDRDYEKEKSDLFTASVEHKFTDTNKIRNSLRYSKSKQDYVWTQPDDSKGNAINGFVFRRGNYRFSDITTLQNVTEATGKEQTGSVGHSYAFGLELSREKSESRSGAIQDSTQSNCTAVSMWCASLNNPDGSAPFTYNYTISAPVENKINTIALYAFDTMKFNEQWLLNAGVRADHYKVNYASSTYQTERSDTLFNYQLGLVYKPAPNGSIYANIGTSSRPGGSSLGNGTEDLAITSDALAELKPEKTRSIELGTKWEFLGRRLELDAALFQVKKEDARERLADGSYVLAGEQRVRGLELSASGKLNEHWDLFATYTYLDSETLKSSNPQREGQALGNTPPRSLSLWSTYELPEGVTLGYGARYVSQRNVTSVDNGKLDAYWVHNMMLGYQATRDLKLQLNLDNLFDKAYVERVRQVYGNQSRSSAIEYGDGRTAILSAIYAF